MVLRNFYNAMVGRVTSQSFKIINLAGAEISVDLSNAAAYSDLGNRMDALVTSYTAAGNGIMLGDGDVPPTFDDYKLSGNIITGVIASITGESVFDEAGGSKTAFLTITNNNSESVTIREIGLKGYRSMNERALVERTVLESPITIEPGGVGQVTYTIRMNYPTV